MCGRYVTPDEAAIERYWALDRRSGALLGQRFNVAPTARVPILRRADDGAVELTGARWGLIPVWWKKDQPPTLAFNARSEEAAGKPLWRQSYRHQRCLMPARGWYEWRAAVAGTGGTQGRRPIKQPYFIECPTSPLIAFAGLMARWEAPDGDAVLSCALLTKAAAPSITEIHDRMPVVLPPEAFEAWLDPDLAVEEVGRLVSQAREDFRGYPVSVRVNDPRNDDPSLLEDMSSSVQR